MGPTQGFDELPLKRRASWVIMLGAMTAVGAFTIDLYLPAFPTMQRQLHTSASTIQLTLTGTLVGMAIGQLVAGPLSDAFGRRRPLLAGFVIHLLASLGCAVAPSIAVLGVMRVGQGAGAAAGSAIALAVVNDRFSGTGATRLIARLVIIIGVSPILAPSLGSVLLPATGWRGVFVVLAVLSLGVGSAAAAFLPETLPPQRRRPSGVRTLAGAYKEVLSDLPTLWLLLVTGLSVASLFGYVAGSSFVFQDQYDLSGTVYALLFAAGGVFLVLGSQISGSLAHRCPPVQLVTLGLAASSAFAVLLFADALTGLFGVVGIIVPACGVLGSFGLGQPAAQSLVLQRHGRAAGTTAALLGALQFGVAALAAPAVSAFGLKPAVGMAVVMLGGLVLALAVYLLLARPGMARPPREIVHPGEYPAAKSSPVLPPGT